VDTSLFSPEDIAEKGEGYPVSNLRYPAKARSIVVLERCKTPILQMIKDGKGDP